MTATIERRISDALGNEVTDIRPLGGGCVGDVRRARLADGTAVVVKTADAGLGVEADMLRYLGRHGLPVPAVHIGADDLLIMGWIEGGGRIDDDAEEHAADLIAALHGHTSSSFGFARDTVIAALPQPNPETGDWRAFFAEQRLLFMAGLAHHHGTLDATTLDRVERLCGRLERWIGADRVPSLIHGDLWGGNVLAGHGRIAGFIDPAIYYADAEIELAFTALFSTFGARFFARYQEHRPLDPDFFEVRLKLYNLYPLLVHTRLFGGSYLGQVKRTLEAFGC